MFVEDVATLRRGLMKKKLYFYNSLLIIISIGKSYASEYQLAPLLSLARALDTLATLPLHHPTVPRATTSLSKTQKEAIDRESADIKKVTNELVLHYRIKYVLVDPITRQPINSKKEFFNFYYKKTALPAGIFDDSSQVFQAYDSTSQEILVQFINVLVSYWNRIETYCKEKPDCRT